MLRKKLALVLCMLLLFTGCDRTYTTDVVARYRKFLDYTAGPGGWEVLKTSNASSNFIVVRNYKTWELRFNDLGGEAEDISFSNNGSAYYSFTYQILMTGGQVAGRDLKDQMAEYFRDWDNPPHISVSYNIEVDSDIARKILNARNGLRLCDVTAEELLESDDWYAVVHDHPYKDEETARRLFSQADEFYQAVCDRMGFPVNMTLEPPKSLEEEYSLRAWYRGEDVTDEVLVERFANTASSKYASWLESQVLLHNIYRSEDSPDVPYLYDTIRERGLSSLDIARTYPLYKQAFEQYLVEEAGLKTFENQLKQWDEHLGGRVQKSFYSKISATGLPHITVQNFYHVERLSDEDLAIFRRYHGQQMEKIPPELTEVVARTYSRVLPVVTAEESAKYGGAILFKRYSYGKYNKAWVNGDTLVVGLAVSSISASGNSSSGLKHQKYHKEQAKEMKKRIRSTLGYPVRVILH